MRLGSIRKIAKLTLVNNSPLPRINPINKCVNYHFVSIPYSNQSFYDWKNPETLQRVVNQDYILNDLQIGYKNLKQTMKEASRSQFTEIELKFLIYTFLLYQQKSEILEDFIAGLQKFEKAEESIEKLPDFLWMAKQLLRIESIDIEKKQIIINALNRRARHPPNMSSIDKIHQTLQVIYYDELEDLDKIFLRYQDLFYDELQKNNFKLPSQTIRNIMSTGYFYFHKYFSEKKLFLSKIPTFQDSQQKFINLLNLLPKILTSNFCAVFSHKDLEALNSRIAECKQFKSLEAKCRLQDYSTHLVIIDKINLVNFTNLLDKI